MTTLYKDPSQPVTARVEDLLAQMTLAEKIAQMHAFWLVLDAAGNHRPRNDAFTGASDAETLQRQLQHGLGQITRPLGTHPVDALEGVRALNALQRHLVESTRLGVPALSHEECLLGLMAVGATLYPSALAMSATWNPDLIEQTAQAIGEEARSVGCHQGLAPVLDVSRDVRWGRTEETFGEDPYLIGVLATRYVQGLQGPKRDLLATLKHYVGHSFSEGARNHAPVHLGWKELNDIFMLPFEMAVKQANAGSVMPAYHDIDNEPLHASHHLLTEVLREQWGFDGLVVADYVGISLLYQHHGVAQDRAEAAAQSFNAGLDVELPGDDCATHLQEALERGLISQGKIDEIVRRVLTEKFRLGLFERPYVDESGINLRSPKALALARSVAQQSVVILENNGILPLAANGTQNIAVIGPTADDPLALLGGYSFPVHLILSESSSGAEHVITPLAGLRTVFGESRISYAPGCKILEQREYGSPVFPGDVESSTDLQRQSPVSTKTDLIADAVTAAKEADIAIVCVGDLAGLFQTGTVGEGSDTDSLNLPGVQQQLLQAVVDTGKPVIVVVMGGRPYSLQGLESHVAAYVMAFTGGEQGGVALAEVLAGLVEPSGRMTVSIPKSAGAVPYYYNHKLKSAGTPIAFHFGSAYPFGYGQSYTTFEYADLVIAPGSVDIQTGDVACTFSITNTGTRPGVAVPQVYIRDQLASLVRPVQELKAFGRFTLAPGERRQVSVRIPVDMLNFTGSAGARIVEPGDFDIRIGASSADIQLRGVVTVAGAVRTLARDWRMQSECK
ncbi:glycoside hydrolase family 3 N-terminal domain-containing protein [Silvimonas soli]|uniref:glycoside hydrolase family 3 N-terminal domain-containing protein n=1 Tax=Silvimonas soli TaxID=2980100 RepID=UPI0024B3456F|nr:glycoside hydrolase family 3 N-terminal domain-containing protein [Silvimonas soli]